MRSAGWATLNAGVTGPPQGKTGREEMKNCIYGIVGGCALTLGSGAALGGVFSAGDFVYTANNTDSIMGYSYGGGSSSTLLTLPDTGMDYRMADIQRVNGRFYVASGFGFPDTEGPGRLLVVDNLFSGAPTFGDLAFGAPIQAGIGLEYHAGTDQFLVVNNTALTHLQTAPNHDGIIGVDRVTGAMTQRFTEDVQSQVFPRYAAGTYITPDAVDSNVYYTANVNGGNFRNDMSNEGISSQIYRVEVDGGGNTAVSRVVDFDGTVGAFGPLTFVVGITSALGNDGTTDLFVTDINSDAIYRVDVDLTGAFVGLDLIIDGLDDPQTIEYNPFRNTLIFHELGAQTISEVNLDGSGLNLLESGVVSARGIYVIPTPGAAGLFGLAGLAAMRRRR